jgi:prepilin-type N-terminal cleavage/methylation domain-containing protein
LLRSFRGTLFSQILFMEETKALLVQTRNLSPNGFSLLELLIVTTIMVVLSIFALSHVGVHRKLYGTDDVALRIVGLMREANMKALTTRQTIKVELNSTTNIIRMIDENNKVVRSDALPFDSEIKIVTKPTNLTSSPPTNYPDAVPLTTSDGDVWSTNFRLNGSVVNSSGSLTSSTLYIWETEDGQETSRPSTVRSITVFSGTAAIRLWGYNGSAFEAR